MIRLVVVAFVAGFIGGELALAVSAWLGSIGARYPRDE